MAIRRWNSPNAKANYVSFADMMNLDKPFLCCVEEPYGIPLTEVEGVPRIKDINYGHVVGALNEADKNEWDIIFPGHTCALNLVVCDKIIGYVYDSKGNHKLIGRCYQAPDFTESDFEEQLRKYVRKRKSYDEDCQARLFGKVDEKN
jgi:hypothetical protein